MDTRLRNLLHDLASEMPVEVETTAPPTLKRARGRRALTGAGAVVAVIAFVAVSLSVVRLVSDPSTPAVPGPTPAEDAFPALWPETDLEALAETQAAVDDGHMPLRTTPDGTASLLATNLLGWAPDDVQVESMAVDGAAAQVVMSNRPFGDDVPPITVEIRQLGDTGPNGIWSVVDVSTPLIELDPVEGGPSGTLQLSGRVTDTFEGAQGIEGLVLDGPNTDPGLAGFAVALEDTSFEIGFDVSATPDGEATLLVTMPDATGASLGAVMTPVATPTGEPQPGGVDVTGVPADVAATAQRIYDAAQAGDVDGLGELLDPDTFVYNLDDGSDPTEAWRANPSELDLMVAILEMSPTTRDIGPGYGTFYFWPYLVNADLEALTPEQRTDLASLGYTDEEIQLMIDGGTGYQGPRLAIDENGEWRNFITVGE